MKKISNSEVISILQEINGVVGHGADYSLARWLNISAQKVYGMKTEKVSIDWELLRDKLTKDEFIYASTGDKKRFKSTQQKLKSGEKKIVELLREVPEFSSTIIKLLEAQVLLKKTKP